MRIAEIFNTGDMVSNNLLDPRICKPSLMAIKLENRAQKVGWKTLEREELLCVRESVVLKPYSDA